MSRYNLSELLATAFAVLLWVLILAGPFLLLWKFGIVLNLDSGGAGPISS